MRFACIILLSLALLGCGDPEAIQVRDTHQINTHTGQGTVRNFAGRFISVTGEMPRYLMAERLVVRLFDNSPQVNIPAGTDLYLTYKTDSSNKAIYGIGYIEDLTATFSIPVLLDKDSSYLN